MIKKTIYFIDDQQEELEKMPELKTTDLFAILEKTHILEFYNPVSDVILEKYSPNTLRLQIEPFSIHYSLSNTIPDEVGFSFSTNKGKKEGSIYQIWFEISDKKDQTKLIMEISSFLKNAGAITESDFKKKNKSKIDTLLTKYRRCGE